MSESNKDESPMQQMGRIIWAELTLGPGRLPLILRIVVACTLVMVVAMVFRIPGAALGAYYPLLLLRDSPRATARAAGRTGLICILATAEIILGAMLFSGSPFLHFFWVAGSLFAVFYLISAMTMYDAALAAGLLITNAITTWDRTASADARVTQTLFTLLSILVACAVSVAIDYMARPTHPPDALLAGIRQRLRLVGELLEDYAGTQSSVLRLSTVLSQLARKGTGALRERLAHSGQEPTYKVRLATALALSGTLVELAANLYHSAPEPSAADRVRYTLASRNIAAIEARLAQEEAPEWIALPTQDDPSGPLLIEIERNIDLITQAFNDEHDLANHHLPPSCEESPSSIFASDAFSGNRHLRFAIRGSLSALTCYVLYMSVGWTGLNASIATCILTALPHTGASRHKQLLRFAGMLVGACVLGFGTQTLVLPQIDSLFSFALLFASIIAIGAWVSTSGPRIAYAGAQIVLAYDLVNLSRFGINTSLIAERDTVLGILLGILAMWLIFDHLWSEPSAPVTRSMLLAAVREVAGLDLLAEPQSVQAETHRLFAQSARINTHFDDLRNRVDFAAFESFPKTENDELLNALVRQLQPQLRSFLLVKVGLLQHRLVSEPSPIVQLRTNTLDIASGLLHQAAQFIAGDRPENTVEVSGAIQELKIVRATATDAERSGHADVATEMQLCASLLDLALHISSAAKPATAL